MLRAHKNSLEPVGVLVDSSALQHGSAREAEMQHRSWGVGPMAVRTRAETGVKPPRVRDEQPPKAAPAAPAAVAAVKDLYAIGEIPPLGHVPKQMYAWVIRKDRHGPPESAMQVEVVPTWELDSHDVLVLVMAAGVNYNGVWAALGKPISPLDLHNTPYHVAGSHAAGRVPPPRAHVEWARGWGGV